MLHKVGEDHVAMVPNFKVVDLTFPGMVKKLEGYDPWKSSAEEEEELLPIICYIRTHPNDTGLRVMNPHERMKDVDAGNCPKTFPKECAKGITDEVLTRMSGNIFRTRALEHVMHGDGI
eukprot:571971-Heterocapsa_arctica.AAC.1